MIEIIRSVWKALPEGVRLHVHTKFARHKIVLYRLEFQFFSRKTRKSNAAGPVLVAGMFGKISGLRRNAVNIYHMFKLSGKDVSCVDISALSQVDIQNVNFKDYRGAPNGGVVVVCCNPDLLFPALRILRSRNLAHLKVIGFWAWELEAFPDYWVAASDFVDEIWVQSQFIAESLSRTLLQTGRDLPVRLMPVFMPPGLEAPVVYEDPFPEYAGRVIVYYAFDIGSNVARKNPYAVIAAFKEAKEIIAMHGGDAEPLLLLKVHGESAWPEFYQEFIEYACHESDIKLILKKISDLDLQNIIKRIDIVISLHRSEGFGFLMFEAMMAGKPVIATGWSGNTDFMNVDNSVLVPYKMIPVVDPQRSYTGFDAIWAEPDVNYAATKLAELILDPVARTELGHRARLSTQAYCNLARWKSQIPLSVDELILADAA